MRPIRFWFHPAVYPVWGSLALWWNIRLYGDRYKGDNWTSRLWKQTRRGKRVAAEREQYRQKMILRARELHPPPSESRG